jgi:hypothetical protein
MLRVLLALESKRVASSWSPRCRQLMGIRGRWLAGQHGINKLENSDIRFRARHFLLNHASEVNVNTLWIYSSSCL